MTMTFLSKKKTYKTNGNNRNSYFYGLKLRAVRAMTPPDFGRSVNPISARGTLRLMCPPPYYLTPRIFIPSYGPETIRLPYFLNYIVSSLE